MVRSVLIITAALFVTLTAFGQNAELPAQSDAPQFNFLSEMLLEQPPVLQPGYRSDRDQWMLYSPQFRILSPAAQTFLLRKYGYLTDGAATSAAPRAASPNRQGGFSSKAVGDNTRVTLADAGVGPRLQSESCIAVSGQNIVVTYNDTGDGDRISYSPDGGTTWHESQPAFFPGGGANAGDPVVAAGPNGRFYHSDLAQNAFGDLVIGISRSDDGGATWSAPSNAAASVTSGNFSHDKDWMTVDNIPGSAYRGNVYVSWTMFTSNPDGTVTPSIQFVRSIDGGRTWSQAIALTQVSADDTQAGNDVQGSFIAVGAQGEIYVAWFDTRANGGVRVSKSVDGGVTFSDPTTALVRSTPALQESAITTGGFDVAFFHSIAADTTSGPNRGTVYLAAQVIGASGNMDVQVTVSRDGGVTWSAPVRATSDTSATDRFQPDVAVADNGNVGVMFYDRRNDPDNDSLMDVYLAVSSDSALSFPINARVTTSNWPVLPTPLGFRTNYHGDYNKVAASGSNFYVAWGDDRSGLDPDVYISAVPTSGVVSGFVMASNRAAADVLPGGSASYSITTGAAAGIKLSASAISPGITFQFSGNTMTATATQNTIPGTYTIQVTGTNSDGIVRGTVVRLTVHAAQLPRVPVAVTPLRIPAYASQAAADAAGNLHLVTEEEAVDSVRKRIWYRRIGAGTTVADAPQTVFEADTGSPDQSVANARIAVDQSGRIYVVWCFSYATDSHILMSSSSDGRTFSAPLEVSKTSGPLTFAFRPSLSVGSDGTVFVSFVKETFQQSRPGRFSLAAQDLYLARSTDGGATFGDPVNVSRYNSASRTVSTASYPAMALDGDNQPHFALRSSLGDIFYTRSSDHGQTFSSLINVTNSDISISPTQPSLAVDSQKNIYVSWTNFDNDNELQTISVAKSSDGLSFQSLTNLSSDTLWSGAIADWSALGVDAAGNVTAVWRELLSLPTKSDDPNRDMFFSRSSDGGASWSPSVNFTTDLGDTLLGLSMATSAEPPAIAVGGDGRASIFWDDDTGGGTQIWMMQLP